MNTLTSTALKHFDVNTKQITAKIATSPDSSVEELGTICDTINKVKTHLQQVTEEDVSHYMKDRNPENPLRVASKTVSSSEITPDIQDQIRETITQFAMRVFAVITISQEKIRASKNHPHKKTTSETPSERVVLYQNCIEEILTGYNEEMTIRNTPQNSAAKKRIMQTSDLPNELKDRLKVIPFLIAAREDKRISRNEHAQASIPSDITVGEEHLVPDHLSDKTLLRVSISEIEKTMDNKSDQNALKQALKMVFPRYSEKSIASMLAWTTKSRRNSHSRKKGPTHFEKILHNIRGLQVPETEASVAQAIKEGIPFPTQIVKKR